MSFGGPEILIVLAVAALLFGAKKLPELARGMGQAAKEFRGGLHGIDEPDDEPAKADPARDEPTTS